VTFTASADTLIGVPRGAVLLAVGLALTSVPAFAPAAAGQTSARPDVWLEQQGDDYFAGNDLYSSDGVGQSRSAIVRDRTVLVIRIQNDGRERASFTVRGSAAKGGFKLRYTQGRKDVTAGVLAGTLSLSVPSHKRLELRVDVDARRAKFGAAQRVVVSATAADDGTDAARAEVTKIS
jgi:hypothetical protein